MCGSAFQCHEQPDVGQSENPGGPHGQILSGIAVDQGVRDRHHGEGGGRHQHAREHRPQHAHGAAVGVPGGMKEPCRCDIAMGDHRIFGEPPVGTREAGGRSKDGGGQYEAENEWCRAYRSCGIGYRFVVLRVGDGLVQRAQGEGGYEQDQRVEERDAGGGQGAQAPEHPGLRSGAGAEVDRHGYPPENCRQVGIGWRVKSGGGGRLLPMGTVHPGWHWTSSGTFLCGRGCSTPSGTGILSPDAWGVPGRNGVHPAAWNVPGRRRWEVDWHRRKGCCIGRR